MRKKFMVLLPTLCILASGVCGNGTTALAGAETQAAIFKNTAAESTAEESSALDKITEIIQEKFNDTQLSEAVNSNGRVLYVTAGPDEDSSSLGTVIGEASVESWFDYDYVMISQFSDKHLAVSVLLKCDDNQMTDHVWVDDSGNLVKEANETADQTSKETSAAENTSDNSNVSMEYKNALNRGKNYLKYSAFSYSSLVDQLEYEGYSTEAATYAADNCGADWNEQAAKKAQSYLDFSAFSRSGLIDQLVFEGFTAEEAEYGVTAVGY